MRKLEERKDVGRALSHAEQKALLDGLKDCQTTSHLPTVIPLLMLTVMRVGEALSLTWGQVDRMGSSLRVGCAKSSSGTGRTIPINADLASVLAAHRAQFVKAFGEPDSAHFLFASGSPLPTDPTRPVLDLKHGWETLRERACVSCRLHYLRHTFATRLAENGVPESTMLALMGHMSRAMLERYSHIRMTAKRDAVAGVVLRPKFSDPTENSEAVPVEVPVVEPAGLVQ